MDIIDKRNILPQIHQFQEIILELGCGDRKRMPHSIGIDVLDYDCVDIIGDILDVLEKIPDSSVNTIHSHHFFEHVRDVSRLMEEIARVMRTGGNLEVVTPHFTNPYFYSDPTHRNFLGLYTFSYFAEDPLFRRRVPKYKRKIEFELYSVSLGFKSPPPFYFRHAFKFVLEKVFNMNNYMKEFYEENLCHIFPCYEIKYSLRKLQKTK